MNRERVRDREGDRVGDRETERERGGVIDNGRDRDGEKGREGREREVWGERQGET